MENVSYPFDCIPLNKLRVYREIHRISLCFLLLRIDEPRHPTGGHPDQPDRPELREGARRPGPDDPDLQGRRQDGGRRLPRGVPEQVGPDYFFISFFTSLKYATPFGL